MIKSEDFGPLMLIVGLTERTERDSKQERIIVLYEVKLIEQHVRFAASVRSDEPQILKLDL